MKTVDELAENWMKDPSFAKEYNALQPEFAIARAMIAARTRSRQTQAQIARKMRTKQSVIARMEGAQSLPSMRTLLRYAKATNSKLVVNFTEA